MIKDNFVLADRGRDTVFVLSDVIGEYITQCIVRIVINVAVSAWDDTSGADGANVVAFAEVVPADNLNMDVSVLWRINGGKESNLNEFRLNLSRLLPAC